jgi:hypothetical protein
LYPKPANDVRARYINKLPLSDGYAPLFADDSDYKIRATFTQRLIGQAILKTRALIIPRVPDILDERSAEYFIRTRTAWYTDSAHPSVTSPPSSLKHLLPSSPKAEADYWDGLERDLHHLFADTDRLLWPTLPLPTRTWLNARYPEIIYLAFTMWFQQVNVPNWRKLVELMAGPSPEKEHCWRIWGEIRLKQGVKRDLDDVLENGFKQWHAHVVGSRLSRRPELDADITDGSRPRRRPKLDAEVLAPRLSARPLGMRNEVSIDKDGTSGEAYDRQERPL